jgi:hypothetical protein
MMLRLVATSLLALGGSAVSSCGYDGEFRYPCQDPANWESAECQPPLCEASGTCTEYLITETTDAP